MFDKMTDGELKQLALRAQIELDRRTLRREAIRLISDDIYFARDGRYIGPGLTPAHAKLISDFPEAMKYVKI